MKKQTSFRSCSNSKLLSKWPFARLMLAALREAAEQHTAHVRLPTLGLPRGEPVVEEGHYSGSSNDSAKNIHWQPKSEWMIPVLIQEIMSLTKVAGTKGAGGFWKMSGAHQHRSATRGRCGR